MLDTSAPTHIASLEPFVSGRSLWPEGSHYRFHQGGHELVRVVRGAGRSQIRALKQGPGEFALLLEGPVILLCSRFGDALPWLGSPFHWHRVPMGERRWPAYGATLESGADIEVRLVEVGDGRHRITRQMALSLAFTRVLHEAILEQARCSYEPSVERRALGTLLKRCPTPGALVANATIRCVAS